MSPGAVDRGEAPVYGSTVSRRRGMRRGLNLGRQIGIGRLRLGRRGEAAADVGSRGGAMGGSPELARNGALVAHSRERPHGKIEEGKASSPRGSRKVEDGREGAGGEERRLGSTAIGEGGVLVQRGGVGLVK